MPNLAGMDFAIRPARSDDLATVADFTADTFEWGDYVSSVFGDWLDDPDGRLIVSVDEQDTPVALARGAMLSETEAWLQGFRVSESWRRRGLASEMVEVLVAWAGGRGARVVRLLTEAWNTPAQRQVERGDFRRSCDWVVARLAISDTFPAMSSNGGQRARARRKLELAHSSEAIPAWVSWRSGPLVRPSRGLHVDGWRWSKLTAEHLERAGKRGRLWASQAGWVITRRDDTVLYVEWLECGEDALDDMIKSIVDLAVATRVELLRITVPDIDWMVSALDKAGFDLSVMHLYERPL